jgi:hypothetical protein
MANNEGDAGTSLVANMLTSSQEKLISRAYPVTRAQGNFISHNLFTRLELVAEQLPSSHAIRDGLSGEDTNSLGTIGLHWYVRDGKQLHTTQFHVIENGRFDIIRYNSRKGPLSSERTVHIPPLLLTKDKRTLSKGWACVFTAACFGFTITEPLLTSCTRRTSTRQRATTS